MTAALACKDVSVRFGSFEAISKLSLHFQQNRVTALIGPNGAGKTTLMNVLSGLQRPSSGCVELHGNDITTLPAWRRVRMGLMRSFQIVSVLPELTLSENLRLAVLRCEAPSPVWWRGVRTYQGIDEKIDQIMEEHGLTNFKERLAGTLSHGEQRALDLALSVTGSPSVLLLDEPLAGVGHAEYDGFLSRIAKICTGRTVVLVEHNMDAVTELADHLVCLSAGKVLAEGTPKEVREDPHVRSAYLGNNQEARHVAVA